VRQQAPCGPGLGARAVRRGARVPPGAGPQGVASGGRGWRRAGRRLAGVSARKYYAVLRHPHVAWLLASSLVGRLPAGMMSLALILRVTDAGGSYARAGLVSGAYVAGVAVSGPVLGRAAGRLGRRTVLTVTAVAAGAATVAVAAAPADGELLLILLGLVAGSCTPPLPASARALWGELLGEEDRAVMYSAEATLQELVFILGPALVALVAALAGPGVALVVTGALGTTGTLAFAAVAVVDRRAASTARRRTRVVGHPELGPLLLNGLLVVAGCAVVEVSVVAFVSGQRASASSGLLLAIWSAGSLVGGASFGTLAHRWALWPLAAAVGIGFLLPAAAQGRLELGALLVLAGAALAPCIGRLYGRLGEASPPGSATEVFGWLTGAFTAGAASGAALGGAVVAASGARVGFLTAAALGLAAAAVVAPWPALTGRSRSEPRAADTRAVEGR